MRWRLALASRPAFLATGIYGAWAYVHNYRLYRGFPAPSDPQASRGRYVEVISSRPALGHQDRYLVYEPPGFQQLAASGTRFPVLYLLHGTTATACTYIDVGRAGVDARRAAGRQRTRPFLIVMPASTDGSLHDDTEWANAGDGRFESETLEVVRQVDRALADPR